MKFLEAVARAFADCDNLQRTCFVFPSRRSSLFFQKYLGLAAGRPLFCPHILTIDELFGKLSPLKKADSIEALSLLYRDYLAVKPQPFEGEQEETFDRFIYWGDILLRDFDDLDKYLADTEKILVNVANLKDLSVSYDFLTERQRQAIAQFCRAFDADSLSADPSDKKRMFITTWNLLLPLYRKFKETLAERKLGYSGMIYRDVVERGGYAETIRKEYDKVVFVGLNALSQCEKKLMDTLRDEGIADFYWDFRGKMVTDPENRACFFVKENVERYPSEKRIEDWTNGQEQYFEVIAVPSAVGQTRIASSLLQELHSRGLMADSTETAVVLPDESLLQPMLGAVPECIGNINVTMGYPLAAGNTAGFFSIVERLQNNVRVRGEKVAFYHKDVLDMLEHPYFARSFGEKETLEKLALHIRRDNLIFVSQEHLVSAGGIFPVIFRYVPETGEIPDYQLEIIENIESEQTDTEREFLYHYHKTVSTIKGLDTDWDMNASTYYRLLNQCVGLISIPYRGEPLSGLQIMGPLETRALDFENVIMLSAGEGVFPSKTVSASFIPYNIRTGFGLPTYEYHDSVWAYYFYRSICRAKRIYLIYDSRTEGLQSGEESRFIKQLKYQYNVPLRERVAAYRLEGGVDEEPETAVGKGEPLPQSFSASALNTYIDCPLKYYYQYVKRIGEPDEVVEELDAGLFGSIYHAVMENIYRPLVGKTLSREDILSVRRDKTGIGSLVDSAFLSEAKIEETTGRNIILKQLIIKYIDQTLKVDSELAPFKILGTEQKADCRIDIGEGRLATLFGIIDRLDTRMDGIVRVVDYKSGKVDGRDNCTDVEKLFDRTIEKRPSIAFQLYFYALLMKYRKGGEQGVAYSQCIYSLRSIFSTAPEAKLIDPEKLDLFEERLSGLIREIYDPSVPFTSRKESGKVCEYCNFKNLCQKK
ncbi:MAG: PD-(D/E)XK nuclease family protein [Bacteroidales bacterium]|nr:PD-(D/E)XK nuclease family protein [Candidatus Cacconaster scatequi]